MNRAKQDELKAAAEVVRRLPDETIWFLTITDRRGDAAFNIYVPPAEIGNIRRHLGLSADSQRNRDLYDDACEEYQWPGSELIVSLVYYQEGEEDG